MTVAAANPACNATVTASAGSGKTWMLVTRILRLLLAGAEPGGILALTFTRKAAAEMQQRLAERLYQLATADVQQLDKLLEELGAGPDPELRRRARGLYEFHQYCDYPVRTQTFHSFCQDLLTRFPLEADVPPGFELLDSSSLLIRQARDALFNEAALDMNGELAERLQALMDACGGLFNLTTALESFLHHRSDWWAYSEGQADPCAWAGDHLQQQLGIDPQQDPLAAFFNDRNLQMIHRFAKMLADTQGKTNLKHADELARILAEAAFDEPAFDRLAGCFLTRKNTAIVSGRKDSQSLRKKLAKDADEFLQLAEQIPERILCVRDELNKQHSWRLNQLWYQCGEAFVTHYQKLKRELRQLDFTDLEWRSYRLLQHSDNALWVQYKLDQRIDHLLIDEFQDTNPTQWQLLLPLLEEMAQSEEQRSRSVFLVGDEKQSIYSFRRAKPELQARASQWLADQLQAQAFPLNKSWRSSPAIMQTVNAVFEQADYQSLMESFSRHDTHHQSLPGRVEIFPALENPDDDAEEDESIPGLRNPLQQPRAEKPGIYLDEGRLIAEAIKRLLDSGTLIGSGASARPVRYDDIFILVRKRIHLADYEQALRQAGIPYLGANRGTLLDCIEIQDMEALLDTLLTPFNNLALAQVLKSPLFSASDEDLMQLAQNKSSPLWIERLADIGDSLDDDHPLRRARHYIQEWRALVDRIPVHDLLDRIYHQANLLDRYQAATPPALRPRVQANLTRFLELALDLDSGRYPSLMHFLQTIRSLKSLSSDAPDEAPMQSAESRVKIMTIHASKGLEAPVVFLADCISIMRDHNSMSTLVDWPVDQPRPTHFQLIPGTQQRDSLSESLLEKQRHVQDREQANLLYVALTRAKQILYISACKPKQRGPMLDWYHPLQNALRTLTRQPEAEHIRFEFGELQTAAAPASTGTAPTIALDDNWLSHDRVKHPLDMLIAPSRFSSSHTLDSLDEDAQTRGLAVHRCLELLTGPNPRSAAQLRRILCAELELGIHDPLIDECINEAQMLIADPQLAFVFHPDDDWRAYNECPLHYQHQQQGVYGLIDRLLVNDRQIIIIDYKSHIQASTDNLSQLAEAYREQMQYYAQGVAGLWPNRKLSAYLLFTHCGCLQPMPVQ
jgi:ATP-dependent helicase/nuclease subunit A